MEQDRIACPKCQTVLKVPPQCVNRYVRCGKCHLRFKVVFRIGPPDSVIAGWLHREEPDLDAESEQSQQPAARPGDTAILSEVRAQATAVGAIRIVRFDQSGALFEFPANRLLEPEFRSAMPRQCLRCGVRTHLRAHVVIFSGQLTDSYSLEDERSAGALTLSESEVRNLSAEALLKLLPRVPNVPPPADRPMAYWTCDMCSGAGMISAQIQVNQQTGDGFCRLWMRNLRRAEEFMAVAGGKGTREYEDLVRYIEAMTESPWDSLPEVVQHRIEQWYRPQGDEQFLAYIPDRRRTRPEDGMEGMLVTNYRLIYNTKLRHQEMKVTDPLEVEIARSGSKGTVHIKSPSWEAQHMQLDRDGMDLLRTALAAVKMQAVMH